MKNIQKITRRINKMKAINITKQDLVKNMTDEQKHRLTLSC